MARGERLGRHRHLFLAVAALLFQVVPPFLIWSIASLAYGEVRRLSEAVERPVTLLTLGFSAAVSLLLGCAGVYGLLTRARLRVAVPLIVVCCMPALFGAALYLHGLLLFLPLA